MSTTTSPRGLPLSGALALAAAFPVVLFVAFLAGESLILGAAAVAGIGCILAVLAIPGSLFLKLCLGLVSLRLLQNLLGFMNVETMRGLNVANVGLLAIFAYWIVYRSRRPRFYRPRSIDAALILAVVLIPTGSILWTHAFDDVAGYSFGTILGYYKRWVTPFMLLFFVLQCMQKKKDLRTYLMCLLVVTTICVIGGVFESSTASQADVERGDFRSLGIISEPNVYSCFLNQMTPFVLLFVFVYRGRPFFQLFNLLLVGGMAVSLLLTYSRAGYLGFGMVLVASIYVGYRSGGHVPVAGPAAIGTVALLMALVAAPDMFDKVSERFSPDTYDRNVRTSENLWEKLNNYSGGRIHLWENAVEMWKQSPLFGVGYRTYIYRIAGMHRKGIANSPHSQYLGVLAEGGILWLGALLWLYFRAFRVIYLGWRAAIQLRDRFGLVLCGGGAISFLSMIWMGATLDFLHPSANTMVFWVTTGVCLSYSYILLEEQKQAAEEDARLATSGVLGTSPTL